MTSMMKKTRKVATGDIVENMRLEETAKPWVENFIERNTELEAINEILQPLLYELSLKLHPDGAPVSLHKLVEDSIKFIKGEQNEQTS